MQEGYISLRLTGELAMAVRCGLFIAVLLSVTTFRVSTSVDNNGDTLHATDERRANAEEDNPVPLSFLTYNLGMSPVVPKYRTRRHYLPAFAASLDADIVCLQEVWYIRDIKKIINSADRYPYSFSFYHSSLGVLGPTSSKVPCNNIFHLLKVLSCAVVLCGLGSRESLLCSANMCRSLELDQECVSCVVMTLSGGFDLIELMMCVTGLRSMNSVGILLLSKVEITDAVAVMFDLGVTQFLPRGHIDFSVDGIGRVSCTHLTTDDTGPYIGPLSYVSYQKQQESEIGKLLDYNFDVIVGDINSGLAEPEFNIEEELPSNFDLYVDRGYVSPIQNVHLCTYCEENVLVVENRRTLIDHVLILTGTTSVYAGIQYTNNLPCHGYPLADHYGVRLELKKTVPSGNLRDTRLQTKDIPCTILDNDKNMRLS